MFTRFMPLAVLAVGLSTGAAQATSYYTDYTAWNTDATGLSHSEGFDNYIANAQVLAINSDLTSTASSDPTVSIGGRLNEHRVYNGQFQQFWGTDNRYSSFTWDFAESISGFFVTLLGYASDFTVSFDDGSSQTKDISAYNGGVGGFGIVFNQAISSVTFSTTDDYDISAMDDLHYKTASSVSAVPVPAGLPLLVSGLGGLGLMGWRRKRAAAA